MAVTSNPEGINPIMARATSKTAVRAPLPPHSPITPGRLNSIIIAAYWVTTAFAVWFLLDALHAPVTPLRAIFSRWLLAPFFGIAVVVALSPLMGWIDNKGEFLANSPHTLAAYRRKIRGTITAVHISVAGNIVSILAINLFGGWWPKADNLILQALVLPLQMIAGQGSYYWAQSVLTSKNPLKMGNFRASKASGQVTGKLWQRGAIHWLVISSAVLVVTIPVSILVTGWGLYTSAPTWMSHGGETLVTLTIILSMATLVSLVSTRASIKARTSNKTFDWARNSGSTAKNAAQMFHNWRLAMIRTAISYALGFAALYVPLAQSKVPYAPQLSLAIVGLVQQVVACLVDLPRSYNNGRGRRDELTLTLRNMLVLSKTDLARLQALLEQPSSVDLITHLWNTSSLSKQVRKLNPNASSPEGLLRSLISDGKRGQRFVALLLESDALNNQIIREKLARLATPALADTFRQIDPTDMEILGKESKKNKKDQQTISIATLEWQVARLTQDISSLREMLGVPALETRIEEIRRLVQESLASILSRVSEVERQFNMTKLLDLDGLTSTQLTEIEQTLQNWEKRLPHIQGGSTRRLNNLAHQTQKLVEQLISELPIFAGWLQEEVGENLLLGRVEATREQVREALTNLKNQAREALTDIENRKNPEEE